MARSSAAFRLRQDQAGAEETLQALSAVMIVMVCAGLVLASVHAGTSSASERAARERAQLQGEILLDALPKEPFLHGAGGLNWSAAEAVSRGSEKLDFLPEKVKVVTLRSALGGPELFLVRDARALSAGLVFSSRALPVEFPNGTVEPGVLRAGVAVG